MSRLFPVFTGKTAASRFLFPAPNLLFVKPSPGNRQSSNPVRAALPILFRNDYLSCTAPESAFAFARPVTGIPSVQEGNTD